MCIMVYLAAAHPLALVPWDEDAPDFHVTMLSQDEQAVRSQFSQPVVVYVGSHEGCGCGFQCGQYPEESYEAGELNLRRRSLAKLASYLEVELDSVGEIEVFSCWDGSQAAIPLHHRKLNPQDIRHPDFHFLDGERSSIGHPGVAS